MRSLNTFGVKVRAAAYVLFEEEADIVRFCRQPALRDGPLLVLGGGSNLLFLNDIEGVVAHPFLKGIQVLKKDCESVLVRAMAGENWDDFVAYAVDRGWGGVENLSLIPGSVGASVVQNIGAYGVEVESVVHSIQVVSLSDGARTTLFPDRCGFGYRSSHFKADWAGRYIISAVTFRLHRQPAFVLDYAGVQTAVDEIGELNLKSIRQAIIGIRQKKLPNPTDIGNAGSFFKNPVVDAAAVERLRRQFPDIPYYPHFNNRFKLAAGWMIEQCGFKGKCYGRAAVHDHQALVLVNRGGATGREILELSEQVRQAILERFGISLEREVQVVTDGVES